MLRRKGVGEQSGEAPSIVYDVLRSPGEPLDTSTRGFMESRFGQGFSHVRVHQDARAAESARAVNALAYTVGSDVVFDAGQYRPRTGAGLRLLAHELAHVVQQRGTYNQGEKIAVGGAGDRLEREADHVSDSLETASPRHTANVADFLRPTEATFQNHLSPSTVTGAIASPRLQRQGAGQDGKCHTGPEAGAVGSVEFCVDFCSGHWRASGWVWVGAGYRVALGCTFVGASAMYEGTLAEGDTDSLSLFNCGSCTEECKESGGISGGIAGFPNLFSPSAGRQSLEFAGLECGLLFTASSSCRGSLEGICFLDVIQYLGPVGRAITKVAEKLGLEAKAGIDGGVTIDVCKGVDGGIVVPKGEVCLGGFIEVGKGLSKNKADHK